MTTSSSASPQGAPEHVDTGPLSWVMGEIREALTQSRAALSEAIFQDADTQKASLRLARNHLHQAHGALQIVDIDGIAIITETIEDLLDRIDGGKLALTQKLVSTIEQGYQALTEYLEELLSGVPHQPVRLFPYYRALLEARGAERIHPADLFFPNLAIRPQLPISATAEAVPSDYANLRQRFERALLPFLKSADRDAELAHAAAMRDLIGEIEAIQLNPQARAFWWVLHGFAETVAAGQLQNEIYVKQLFGRINLQIRRLSQGAASTAERLLRDALFFIAQATEPLPRPRQIRAAYQLDGLVPPDYEKKRYGQIDIEALVAAKEKLVQAKAMWNRIAGGDVGVATSFENEMHGLVSAGVRLNVPSLTKLLRELNGIARHAVRAEPGDSVGLELAASLLFVENALNNIGRLPENFAERADALTARLLSIVSGDTPAEAAQWLDDMSREAQQRQTMTTLSAEMQANLRQVEKTLDEYFRDPAQQATLAQLDTPLRQLEGALAILDLDDAVHAVEHTREAVQRFADQDGDALPDEEEFRKVAQNVGALGFFIETLQHDPQGTSTRYVFDRERGVFHADLLEKRSASSSSVDVPIANLEEVPALPTVEDELALHQLQSAALAMSLQAEPDNTALQEQLRESLEQVRLAAALVDNPEANDRAQAGIAILKRADVAAASEELAEIVAPAPDVPPPPVVPPPPQTDEAIDAELLEIFLTEAVEVLGCIRDTVPASCQAPHDQEYLTTLRRSFHTLKGSGRMVGLTTFGEAAWSIEQVLNLRLAEARSGDADLYALLEKAEELLGAWVEDLRVQGRSVRSAEALVAAAERVKNGEAFRFEGDDSEHLALQPAATPPSSDAIDVNSLALDETVPLPQVEEVQLSDADLAMFQAIGVDDAIAAPGQDAAVIAFPGNDSAQANRDHIKRIGDIEIGVPLYNIYLSETDELVRRLAQDIAEWRHEPERAVNTQSVHAAHSLAGSSATVGFRALHELAYALEMALQFLARTPVMLHADEFDMLERCVERLKLMLQEFALGEMPPPEPEYVRLLADFKHDLQARSLASPDALAFVISGEHAAPETLSAEGADTRTSEALQADPAMTLKDEIDADLLPVFLEEGRDMLPQMGQALRLWQEQPANTGLPQSLLRVLHTLKGSARMAGAMNLGQHLHDMETRIENLMRQGAPASVAVDDLLVRYDQALYMFERLQRPAEATIPEEMPPHRPAIDADDGLATAGEPVVLPTLMPQPELRAPADLPAVAPAAVPANASPLVRVRADLLDRLVNQAGEVSISRSRLETGVGGLRQSLSELTENVARLREQLREIEMQAESQITSRMAQSADREFDPLEFDRFTRLQELTRMMAESVADVGAVQHSLARTLDNAVGDLSVQARLTRDLQQDLMRVRMVQFASISERLFRVTRQTAKEIDKRVNLDIRGSAVELDRGVLEKMTGPFEHLLRNAIVHGIESREARRAAGKNETGELLIEVRQEGNEVVIQFSDDGQGLNLNSIRSKARHAGLLTDESKLSDDEVRDLIFQPGFSTAEEITELAGRGVGMDVVRSEAAALGGRVSTRSVEGKGAQFTIHLPLTLAVTQVVLLSSGGKTYAVPSVLVEQVQQLKANPLAAAYNDGAVMWQGQRVPMYYLPSLLGDAAASPVAQQYSPVMILRSGNDRVALHVDEILGNREVVVKNIGPQLARLIGIAGATVLGSGDIVLILNPVPLAQRVAHDNIRAPRILGADVPQDMGAVAELAPASSQVDAAPIQGLRTQNIVMVVDDSLTVRRVTQRLLSREGYQVVLAKDGVDALQHLQSITPDVMLVDIEMPRMDGFDLTRNVRSDTRTRDVPIIMITSRTAAKHRNYALELGVNEYLGKPYREDVLLQLIGGFVGKVVPTA